MKEILPTKLIAKMIKARHLSNEHMMLIEEIDNEMIKLGFDVDRIREDDSCGYVDMIDYGRGQVDMNLILEYKDN